MSFTLNGSVGHPSERHVCECCGYSSKYWASSMCDACYKEWFDSQVSYPIWLFSKHTERDLRNTALIKRILAHMISRDSG